MLGEQARNNLRSRIAASLTAALLALAAHIQPAAATGPRPLDAGAIDVPTEPQSSELLSYRLSTGNVLLYDPGYDMAGAENIGATFLYDGATGALISKLLGTSRSGPYGQQVFLLTNGNFVIYSDNWSADGIDPGAVIWGNGTSGITGVVSSSNSLVGIGSMGIKPLPNGNFVAHSSSMWNGRGIVMLVDGSQGITGVVTESMGLVGSQDGDGVGIGVTILSNGNFLVRSWSWDNVSASATDAGAVTWVDGSVGITGEVNVTNSLVGTRSDDGVGLNISTLPNGNYFILSPDWDHGAVTNAGAVTWADGSVGITGEITITNSLVGSTNYDDVGTRLCVLKNGNVVVSSPNWNNGSIENAGAVTWIDGSVGITGEVSFTNSLVGDTSYDRLGWSELEAVTELANGNYVILHMRWHDATGAATWASGMSGITGFVTTTNSLVGTAIGDFFDASIVALTNGNYVVGTPRWRDGAKSNVGAATWASGASGITGTISAATSLIGEQGNTKVGSAVISLTNGNYVVASDDWDNGTEYDAGAVTWGNGSTGTTGTVTLANSLVGSSEEDDVGARSTLFALANGNYLVGAPYFDNGDVADVGSVTWGNGNGGTTGTIAMTNSLLGHSEYAEFGRNFVGFSDGGYLTWGNVLFMGDGTEAISGVVAPENSIFGIDNADVGLIPNTANGFYIAENADWEGPYESRVLVRGGSLIWNPTGIPVTGWLTSTNFSVMPGNLGGLSAPIVFPNGDAIVGHEAAFVTATSSLLWLPNDRMITGTVESLSGYSARSLTTATHEINYENVIYSTTASGTPTLIVPWKSENMLRILRRLRSDISLSSLEVSVEGLTPSFISTTLSYTASTTTAGSIVLTSTVSDSAGAVSITNAAGPCTSDACALIDGWNTITITALAEDWTPKHYTLTFYRFSNDASLSDLALSVGTLVPSFVSSTTNYTASVPNAEASLIVTPTTNSAAASFVVSNAAGDCPSNTCPLDLGANTLTVTVTASDGATTQTYVLVVTREPAPTPTPTPTEPPTPTETPEPTVTPTPIETPTPTETPEPPAAGPYVSPRYGAVTTSTLRIIGPNGSGFTGATGVYVNGVKQYHVVVNDKRIVFVMKPGIAGATVDVVLVKAGGKAITITQAYTFEAPTSVVLDSSTGGVLTTTSGVTITMPSQSALRPAAPAVGSSMVVTYAPIEQPAEPPGDLPLSFFDVRVSIDDSPISTLINPATLDLPVDPSMVPAGQIARLFEWTAASRSDRDSDRGVSTTETIAATVHTFSAGQWLVVRDQTYDSITGRVTAPIQRLGAYALVAMPANQWWFPLVTLE